MASETSGKAKLGTAVALIGGTIGSGIVIYALMGGDIPVPMMSEKTEKTPAVTQSEATNEETASTVSNASNDAAQTTSTQTEEPTQDTSSGDATEVEEQSAETEAPKVESEAGVASDETETSSGSTEELATTQEQSGEQDDASATAETSEDAQAPAEPETEVASIAAPETEEPTAETPAQSTVDQPEEPENAQPSDAPVVATDDPVMPGAEPVILQSADAPSSSGPALDPSDPAVPKFDLVRIEADGSTVIAGRATPNAEVQILSNGEEIGTATASARGEFVALIDTEITSTAQSLALVADAPSTGRVTSQSNVIVLARSSSEIDNLDEEISLAPAIVQSTPDAVQVIQPVVGLADLDRVSLDTISYDEEGQVILAGRGRPGYTARIYADGRSLLDSKISGSGTWSATINELDAGRYSIRVDELDTQGDVASRVESPFQRIFPTAEQLALLTDATSVIVQPGNNLWTIAEGRYGEGVRYTTIFEANKEQIRDPDLIYPGQVFELPEGAGE